MNLSDVTIKVDGVAIENCSTVDVSWQMIDLDRTVEEMHLEK